MIMPDHTRKECFDLPALLGGYEEGYLLAAFEVRSTTAFGMVLHNA